MHLMWLRRVTWLSVTALGAVFIVQCGGAPESESEPDTPTIRADWPMYRGDLAGTGYSPLAEITPANASTLVREWTYSLQPDATETEDGTPLRGPNSQATPIVVNNVMYVPAPDRVVALEPESGRELWRHTVADGAPSRRGVAYWPGADGMLPRVIFTAGRRLVALDAASGDIVPEKVLHAPVRFGFWLFQLSAPNSTVYS